MNSRELDAIGEREAGRARRGQRLTMPTDSDNGCLIGPTGCHHHTPRDLMYFGVLDLCGCGCPNEVHAMLVECAKAFSGGFETRGGIKEIERIAAAKPDVVAEFIAHFLSSRDLTEHGGSVYGSWLTDLGEQFVEVGPMSEDDGVFPRPVDPHALQATGGRGRRAVSIANLRKMTPNDGAGCARIARQAERVPPRV